MAAPAARGQARHDRDVAGFWVLPDPDGGDGQDRLSLRRQLVDLAGFEDPVADSAVRPEPPRPLTVTHLPPTPHMQTTLPPLPDTTLDEVELMGLPLHGLTPAGAVEHLIAESAAGRGGYVMTPNLDNMYALTRDPELMNRALG